MGPAPTKQIFIDFPGIELLQASLMSLAKEVNLDPEDAEITLDVIRSTEEGGEATNGDAFQPSLKAQGSKSKRSRRFNHVFNSEEQTLQVQRKMAIFLEGSEVIHDLN